ncbi:hypothetical protein BABINDRAFT_31423 [Babjeviella inositovora NRRL Y-12698]|uniref:Ubiquitin-like protease family profile domain-containing protein n=1 Tax=Babjeviella inositovora NRRL Y-12698 TaxID=984486 RepID=A0A1E3QXT3_9ASCO|nr:uncharacterized protein BABINDRAFT_31423 [Babjeviella inositovora NRRL Y-12698]ODQ82354.1 hypothetical protein BABINDRAFT_31423 [Babjeviella inositovora NRRL Y-12698]
MWPESKAAAPASSATANVNYKQPIPSQFEEPSLPSDVIVLEKYDELEKENKLRAERISEIVRDVSDIKPLSDDELRRIGKYWTCANDSVTILSKFNLDVTARDLKTLRNGKWLNDTVIDFYLSLLTDRCMKKGSKLPKSFAFTTHFFSTLKAKGHAGVARWAKRKKVDVTKMDYVFVPMNIQNAHWALAVINNKERRFQYYDSMRGLSSMDALNRLCDYMTDESKRLGVTGIDYTEYEMDADVPAPRQENGYDCGVFTCTNVEYLSRGAKLTFKQSDMQNLRNKMALEVLQGELLQNE